MPSWTIEHWPLRDQADDLLAEIYQARAPMHTEESPGDPMRPLPQEIAELRHMPARRDGVVVVARDHAGAIAGLSRCTWDQLAGWDHMLQARIEVRPGWRRQGLGRVLLGQCVVVAEQRGLRLVMGRTRQSVPSGAAFCASFGLQKAQVSEENRQDLRTVDRELVDRWIAEGPVRAPRYQLAFVEGRTPPDLLASVARMMNVMNTAPRDDLDAGDVQFSPEQVRSDEQAAEAAGQLLWAYYAVEQDSGQFVGFTNICRRQGTPYQLQVQDTAVDPAHRGQGLGKWLKAAMTRRILDGLPDARWVTTWNAGSNDAMLAINRRLGFRVHAIITTWQLATSKLRDRLDTDPAD
jgi:mycothiol synthase